MTVVIRLGRRVPKSLKSRIIEKVKGLIGFQENIWIMLKMSMEMARKKWKQGTEKPKGHMLSFYIDREVESEDTFWKLEWMVVRIQGDKECEQEEYEQALGMYDALKSRMKNKPSIRDENLAKRFKTKLIDEEKLKDAYEAGYGAKKDKNISEMLLEMGIVTHIEWIPDYDERNGMIDING